MFNLKNGDRLNIIGEQVRAHRIKLGISQKDVAVGLKALGFQVNKNSIQRIESGQRFVTDIELPVIAKLFNIDIGDLYKPVRRSKNTAADTNTKRAKGVEKTQPK